jgi:hypothetical protein
MHWLYEQDDGERFAPTASYRALNAEQADREMARLRAVAADELRGHAGREQARRELESLERQVEAVARERERAASAAR